MTSGEITQITSLLRSKGLQRLAVQVEAELTPAPLQGEINPNHGVLQEVRQEWHKLCALAMHKMGKAELVITSGDIEAFTHSGMANITVHPSGNIITLRLVSDEEALRLARGAGGMPV
jgi:hypothetical protein